MASMAASLEPVEPPETTTRSATSADARARDMMALAGWLVCVGGAGVCTPGWRPAKRLFAWLARAVGAFAGVCAPGERTASGLRALLGGANTSARCAAEGVLGCTFARVGNALLSATLRATKSFADSVAGLPCANKRKHTQASVGRQDV